MRRVQVDSRQSVRDEKTGGFLHGVSAREEEVLSAAAQRELSLQEAPQTNLRSVYSPEPESKFRVHVTEQIDKKPC